MINPKPLVSILIPVRNNGEFLRGSLESLRSQTYKNIEIIAIDDKSTDSSWKILRNLKKRNKKLRTYQNIKRYGEVLTLNRLLRKAKGEYIVFMDANDASHRQRVKKQLSFLLDKPEVVAVGTQCVFIGKNNKKIQKSSFPTENKDIYTSPLHGFSMQFETVMINKNLVPKDILKFDTNSRPFVYSDLFLKILPYGKFANLPTVLHSHRNNPEEYLSSVKKDIFSYIKLWLKSITNYDYNPSVRSLFSTFFRPA